jgi:hypothetical protein
LLRTAREHLVARASEAFRASGTETQAGARQQARADLAQLDAAISAVAATRRVAAAEQARRQVLYAGSTRVPDAVDARPGMGMEL